MNIEKNKKNGGLATLFHHRKKFSTFTWESCRVSSLVAFLLSKKLFSSTLNGDFFLGGDTVNKIFISGNLTRDFETGGNDKYSYARAGLAVKRPFAKNDEVDFFNLVAFNKTADFCKKYLSKGRKVFVEGRIQFEEFKDKDGNKRTGHSVIIDNIEFGDNKKTDSGSAGNENDVDVPF